MICKVFWKYMLFVVHNSNIFQESCCAGPFSTSMSISIISWNHICAVILSLVGYIVCTIYILKGLILPHRTYMRLQQRKTNRTTFFITIMTQILLNTSHCLWCGHLDPLHAASLPHALCIVRWVCGLIWVMHVVTHCVHRVLDSCGGSMILVSLTGWLHDMLCVPVLVIIDWPWSWMAMVLLGRFCNVPAGLIYQEYNPDCTGTQRDECLVGDSLRQVLGW